MNASIGATIWKKEKQNVRVQVDVRNLADRLNVINFAGLFSGTAIAAPGSAMATLQGEF